MPITPSFHVNNILNSPATTLAGVAWLANTSATYLSTGLPTNAVGWFGFAFNMLLSAGMAFGK